MPGSWEELFAFGPSALDSIVAVHLIHLRTGKFLALEFGLTIPYSSPKCRLWTPPAFGVSGPGAFETVATTHTNFFCCGHAQLADGRVLTAGGGFLSTNEAPRNADLFDPSLAVGQQWNNPATPAESSKCP